MTDKLEEWQLALLVEAKRYDDPTIVEASEASDFREAKELLEQARGIDHPVVVAHEVKREHDKAEALLEASSGLDDWEVVDADTREAERAAVDAVGEVLSDALAEQYGIREKVVESMSVADMVEQFRDEEDGITLDSLAQQPETGGSPDPDGTGDGDGDGTGDGSLDALSADERNDVREKLKRADRMESRTPDFAATLRTEACELVGVDDAADIDMEAL